MAKLMEDIEYYKVMNGYIIEHIRCRGVIMDNAVFCECEDCEDVSVCNACGKKWNVPYKNLEMSAKMKDFERPEEDIFTASGPYFSSTSFYMI